MGVKLAARGYTVRETAVVVSIDSDGGWNLLIPAGITNDAVRTLDEAALAIDKGCLGSAGL